MRPFFTEPAPADAEIYADLKIVREPMPRPPECSLKIWVGRAQKPTHYFSFKNADQREAYIAEQKKAADARVKYKADRKSQNDTARSKCADAAGLIRNAVHGQSFTTAETAAIIRHVLAQKFPDTKFSVRSHSYSGGSSIDIDWTLGPTASDVDNAVYAFAGRGFDGSIDLSYSKDSWLMPDGTAVIAESEGTQGSMGSVSETVTDAPHPKAVQVHFGAGYVFTHRRIPDDLFERIGRDLCELQHVAFEGPNQRNLLGENDVRDLAHYVREVLDATTFPKDAAYAGVERVTDNSSSAWVKASVKPVERREAVAA